MEIIEVKDKEQLKEVLRNVDLPRGVAWARSTDFRLAKGSEPQEITLSSGLELLCSLCHVVLSSTKEEKIFLCNIFQKKDNLRVLYKAILCSTHFNQVTGAPAYQIN